MKKYLLFAGHCYYPRGGVSDLIYSADTIDECKTFFQDNANAIGRNGGYIDNWGHIVEYAAMKKVCSGWCESRSSNELRKPGQATWETEEALTPPTV